MVRKGCIPLSDIDAFCPGAHQRPACKARHLPELEL